MHQIDEQRVPWYDLRQWLPGPWATDIELQDDEWEREPERHTGEVRYAPARVLWTADPPVSAGLYFCKLLGGSTRVVDVYADDRGRLLCSWSDIAEFPVNRPGMLWGDHAIQEPV